MFTNLRDHINRKLAGTEMILNNYAGHLKRQAKLNAKWTDRSSHARQTLHSGVEVKGERHFVLFLAHGVKYGKHLEEGTPPHVIEPKNGKALYWNGARHPVRKVNHPGTKGDPLLERTIEQNKEKLLQDIGTWWAK